MGAHTQEVGGGRGRWLVCALTGRDREREERERGNVDGSESGG